MSQQEPYKHMSSGVTRTSMQTCANLNKGTIGTKESKITCHDSFSYDGSRAGLASRCHSASTKHTLHRTCFIGSNMIRAATTQSVSLGAMKRDIRRMSLSPRRTSTILLEIRPLSHSYTSVHQMRARCKHHDQGAQPPSYTGTNKSKPCRISLPGIKYGKVK